MNAPQEVVVAFHFDAGGRMLTPLPIVAQADGSTVVSEHIDYDYRSGLAGLLNRLIFSGPALTMLFTVRKVITRRRVKDNLPLPESVGE